MRNLGVECGRLRSAEVRVAATDAVDEFAYFSLRTDLLWPAMLVFLPSPVRFGRNPAFRIATPNGSRLTNSANGSRGGGMSVALEWTRRVVANFWQNFARFRLYRHRSLQVNTRFSGFFKIYQII